jgi:Asp-tRNA(Asn)/Glu-tRNA(Gln) amidotransferase A subunit family amidase
MDPASELPSINRYTILANLAGLPSISVPCGLTPSGLPVGLMLTGSPFSDERLLAIGADYQTHTDWHELRPSAWRESSQEPVAAPPCAEPARAERDA